MNRSCLAWLWMLISAAALAACSTTGSALTGTNIAPPTQPVALRRVATPPGLGADEIQPLKGRALAHAYLPLSAVADHVSVPDYLKPAATEPVTHPTTEPAADEPSMPSLKAEEAYAQGRAAWLAGHRMEGLERMQAALRLAPDRPAILESLGRMWVDAGDQLHGADYLKRAAALDPHNLPTLMLLGRFALNQRNWSDAVAIFLAALHQQQKQTLVDPAIGPLLHYDLGIALRHDGYLLAAVKQYHAYFVASRAFIRPSDFGEQLLYTDQQQGDLWQVVGNLCNRLDRPADALYAYHRAGEAGVASPETLVKARIFTQLRVNQPAMAEQLVIKLLGEQHNSHDGLAMIGYLTRQGVATGPFARRLEAVYRQENRPAVLALAIAHMLDRIQAIALLDDHLKAHPADHVVFKALIQTYLLPTARKPSVASLQQAARLTARQITANPSHAQNDLALLVSGCGDSRTLVHAIEAMSAKERVAAPMEVVLAAAYTGANDSDHAMAAYRLALKADVHLAAARVGLARILIDRRQYDQAVAVLNPLGGSLDALVVHLRVEALIRAGRKDQALALLGHLLKAHGQVVKVVLQMAQLQIQMHKTRQAAQTLRDAINAHPNDQKLYAALFSLYNSGQYQGDTVHGYEQLMQQALRNIPDSRITKLQFAELHAWRGEDDQAVAILQGLLDRNSADAEALLMLAQIDQKDNDHKQAVALFTKAIKAHAKDTKLLVAAQRFYGSTGDAGHFLAVTRKLMQLQPDNPNLAQQTAQVYLQMGKAKQVVKLIDRTLKNDRKRIQNPEPLVSMLWQALVQEGKRDLAVQRVKQAMRQFPYAQADLEYELAMLYGQIGKPAKSEAVLVKVVKAHPDQDRAANALGYTWADAGKHLVRAKKMIARALKARPDEPAYLDSMGWVLYKMGRFKQALKRFQKAVSGPGGQYPIILDHYGDALYRAGRHQQAIRTWRQALEVYRQRYANSQEPELVGLDKKLTAKIAVARKTGRSTLPNLPSAATVPSTKPPF